MMICLLVGSALAQEPSTPPVLEFAEFDLHGDTKSFFIATVPYDHLVMPETASGQGIVDGRLKLEIRGGDLLRFQAHQTLTASAPASGGSSLGLGTAGVGLEVPEAADLSFSLFEDAEEAGEMSVHTRTDRLWLGLSVPHLDLRIGRQPLSFGKGMMFTPMDLVNPFSPAVVDSEYKPGIDSVRADVYWGMANQVTVAAAYAGSWDLDGLVFAAYGQTTLGVWDLGAFAGVIHRDLVGGVAVAGSVGPVGIQGELTVTLPPEKMDQDPFVRAVVGGTLRPTMKTSLAGELYLQTNGAAEPDDYLRQYLDPRYERGELWAVGRYYAGLSVSQELTPTLFGSLFGLVNLADPSALVGPGLSWSISGTSDLVVSGFFGLGERPDELTMEEIFASGATTEEEVMDLVGVNSEFGLMPTLLFAEWKAYF